MPRPDKYGAITARARLRGRSAQSEWADQQLRAGKCAQGCGRRLAKGSVRYCAPCLSMINAHARAFVAERRDAGQCRCGNPLGQFARCDDCRARENAARRKR